MPFARREPDHQAFGVFAVANTDLPFRQACHLYAVAVGKAQGTLDPDRTLIQPIRTAVRRLFTHVHTSLNVV